MRSLVRALRITPAVGFGIGAFWSCGRWSAVWPGLSLAAALRAGLIGWAIGVALAPLASRLRWSAKQGDARRLAWWARVGLGVAILVTVLPAGLWVAAAFPDGLARKALFAGRRRGDQRPNLILITIDALRRDHVGAYGEVTGLTPNLDAFAQEATRYHAAYVSSPWTLTSFASMFTGLPPSECGLKTSARENQRWYQEKAIWPEGIPTLPQRLRETGYGTAAVITNPFLRPWRGCGRGFDAFHNVNLRGNLDKSVSRGDRVTGDAVQWLKLNRREPFFLWVHYLDPHGPYCAPTAPPELRTQCPATWVPSRQYWETHVRRYDEESTARFADFCRVMYAEEVRYADRWVGNLLSAIKASGLYDDSLIMIPRTTERSSSTTGASNTATASTPRCSRCLCW